jgi:hypothetical protein
MLCRRLIVTMNACRFMVRCVKRRGSADRRAYVAAYCQRPIDL